MVENGINQGLVYEGCTATAEYDTSFSPATMMGNENQPFPVTENAHNHCDAPVVVECMAKE